jgi:hypothetical protein
MHAIGSARSVGECSESVRRHDDRALRKINSITALRGLVLRRNHAQTAVSTPSAQNAD